MKEVIKDTNFNFKGQNSIYKGKVRDVYEVNNKLVMIATDRISAFDHVLKEAIPYKGQVLNQMSAYFLQESAKIVPNWFEASPDPNVSIGKICKPIRLEMIIRGYLVGHAWRLYKKGERTICGVEMPEGMKENEKFPKPIITPSFKALEGHDEDISKEEILEKKIVTPEQYAILEDYTYKLFAHGSEMAEERDLILVDTKYEFGIYNDEILLIDEIHTPDSSRYFYKTDFKQRIESGKKPVQLSKEFVREHLMAEGFKGEEGQIIPSLTPDFVEQVSERYIGLYEKMTGKKFARAFAPDMNQRVEDNLRSYMF